MPDNRKHKYTIYCLQGVEYVGSTKLDIKDRMILHRSDCYNPNRQAYNCLLYTHIREYYPGYMFNPEDVIILDQAMLTKAQAIAVEQSYINEFKPSHNLIAAHQELTKSEYAKQKITCPCGTITDKAHLARHVKTKKHINKIKNMESLLNQYYKTSEDKHQCTLKHTEKFK